MRAGLSWPCAGHVVEDKGEARCVAKSGSAPNRETMSCESQDKDVSQNTSYVIETSGTVICVLHSAHSL